MLHIYKAGGAWKKEDGTEYTIKAIEPSRKAEHLKDGWVASLDLIATEDPETDNDNLIDEEAEAKKKAKAEKTAATKAANKAAKLLAEQSGNSEEPEDE